MKCSNTPPRGASTAFIDYEGMPTDHYLWLTGLGGKMLRGDMPLTDTMPTRQRQGRSRRQGEIRSQRR
jgi:hypothetical protein